MTKVHLTWKQYGCGILVLLLAIVAGWFISVIASCMLLVVAALCLYLGRSVFSERRQLQHFIETVPALIWRGTPKGELDFVNRRLLDYCGLTRDDLEQGRWKHLVHPSDLDSVVQNWLQCVNDGTSYRDRYRIRRADGEYRWIESVGEPFRDSEGRIAHWYGLQLDIDDQKQAQDALQTSENELRQILDSVPGMIAVANHNGDQEYANKSSLEYTGMSFEELRGLGFIGSVHPEEQPFVRSEWQRCTIAKQPFELDHRLRRSDGVYRMVHVRVDPLLDAQGNIIRWYGLLTDIEDKRKAEDALRASEYELRMLVETIPALVWRSKPDGEVDYVNQRVLEYTGKPEKDVVNSEWLLRLHPDDSENTSRVWQHNCRNGLSHDVTYRLRRTDGDYRWFHVRAEPLRDENGRVLSYYGVLFDIDDRIKAEGALRASEHQLRLITETIPAMLTTRTASGELEYANQHLVDYTGKSVNELIQAGLNHIHPDDQRALSEVWRQSIDNGRPFEITYRLRRADGMYRWFQSRGEPLIDSSGKVLRWYDLVIDIDDSKALENALRNTQARLARTSQIMAVAELSASIAHEINQPLSSVVANGRACQTWLSNKPPNIERARITVERIVRDAKGAAEVVRTIRSLFKNTAPAKERLDINDLIVEVYRLMANEITKRKVDARLELDRDLPRIVVDRIQIQQVIMNLVQNALDATTSSIERLPSFVVRTRHDGTTIVVEVCDQGIGIRDPDKVFEPFFTTKEDGIGMGLAICRSIIEAHEGQLWATSNSPKGARFIFTLPILDAQ